MVRKKVVISPSASSRRTVRPGQDLGNQTRMVDGPRLAQRW
jgi:hypothetical protein